MRVNVLLNSSTFDPPRKEKHSTTEGQYFSSSAETTYLKIYVRCIIFENAEAIFSHTLKGSCQTLCFHTK